MNHVPDTNPYSDLDFEYFFDSWDACDTWCPRCRRAYWREVWHEQWYGMARRPRFR